MDMNVDKVEELDDETKVLDKKLNIICEKIKQLNEIKAEMQYILTYKNSDELYNILNITSTYNTIDLMKKISNLVESVEYKLEICEKKKKELEDGIDMIKYNDWVYYIKEKKDFVDNILNDCEAV
jgi:hypothetical protein